jgi:bifunctional non-homologous end joining protein LigD
MSHPRKTQTKKTLTRLPAKTAKPANKEPRELLSIDLTPAKDYKAAADLLLRPYKSTKTSMPAPFKPMLATISREAFNDPGWQFEIKWDGYRTLAFSNNKGTHLYSRNGRSFDKTFAPVREAIKLWGIDAVVDGEVVVLNEEGKADFQALQNWSKTQKGQLFYYLFDLLWLEGTDLRQQPLSERRRLLRQLIPNQSLIRYSDDIDECGLDFFQTAQANGLEGIIAKRKDATYAEGQRSTSWLKIKAEQRHETLICGYTKKIDSDRMFSSLVMGIPKGGKLQYIGLVGTGFTEKAQVNLLKKMVPFTTKYCPFEKEPSIMDPVVWLRPMLIGEVKYTELTAEGVMRHPSFQGLREDKTFLDYNADDLDQEGPLVRPEETSKEVQISGQLLKLSNLQKPFWIQERISKGDLLNYYDSLLPFIMPYMQDRPQSLNRHPNGMDGESFYQKNMAGKTDKWLKTFRRVGESSSTPKYFLVCADQAHLLYMVNLGCIELNPWHSTVQQPDKPSWCVIDLDPGDIPFTKVVEAALVVRDLLQSIGIVSYPKTSGSTGLHIYIPLDGRYSYTASRQFAELVATLVHAELPLTTSIIRNPRQRKDKIYIDYLQNRPIQTICAPYSVRPKPGATVSAPLNWDEVNNGLKLSQFTLYNMKDRLRSEGDLFAGVLSKGVDLNAALLALGKLL